jgi:hypothetical protein
MNLATFVEKWSASGASERANKDAFLLDLCDVLGVARPNPTTGNPEDNLYVFERDALLPHEGGVVTVGKIDLYKHECFILEAKQGSGLGSKKLGTAKRDTPAWHLAMAAAHGQAVQYARTMAQPPPFVIVCDIGYVFELYAAFDGSLNYRPFPNPQKNRIYLKDLAQHLDLLRKVWDEPHTLDPSKISSKVTREVAGQLANLAKHLEDKGHEPEQVAKFLMRCVFTMFAEDTGLLPERLFTDALEKHWIPDPTKFVAGIEALWKAMNDGTQFGFVGKLLHFNGGLFVEPKALPLHKDGLLLLALASRSNWADVEPAIFGTLLERALDPRERHALGAHYTPRSFVERLVRATIEDPLREEWDGVQAQVRQLVPLEAKNDDPEVKKARKLVREFHQKLRTTRVLDPACGTGNFLYVALDVFKRLEAETLAMLEGLGDKQTLLDLHAIGTVSPGQFFGLEIKPWAREITDLVLWIGYLQHHFRVRGKVAPPEPVLKEYGNIECRDAVLMYDGVEPVLDTFGKPATRWDGETTRVDPITRENVPDETATLPVLRYLNAKDAIWPEADFVIGNPPFIGNARMKNTLGPGYVDTLRSVHLDVPESSDYVMYWWNHAARLLRDGKLRRFGLITTKTITQAFNRRVLQAHMDAEPGVSLVFAIPNHPWVDSEEGADVRIAMTAVVPGVKEGLLASVIREQPSDEELAIVEFAFQRGRIHADLRVGADVTTAAKLEANDGLSCRGVTLHGAGFLVTHDQARMLGLGRITELGQHIRPYLNGRDIMASSRGLLVIDLLGLTESQVRDKFPAVYQWIVERVKPERDQNNRSQYRDNWWIFGEPRVDFRPALAGLKRYIATVETSRHRVFTFLDGNILPDNKLVVIAADDPYCLGVLSSRIHVAWALATGGRLGVGNDPVYVKSACFEKFPFPFTTGKQRDQIADLAEALDSHRKKRLAEHPGLTLTGMYNALEKLRLGHVLEGKDAKVHEQGLISVLAKLHDDLDDAVFSAYGWVPFLKDEEILSNLAELNAARVAEEHEGTIRWLRPDFQAPTQSVLRGEKPTSAASKNSPVALESWPKSLPAQMAVVRTLVLRQGRTWTVEQVARSFKNARRNDVETVLESLAALGLVVTYEASDGRSWMSIQA